MRSFDAFHFDVTKMPLASQTEHQEALSFAYRSRKGYRKEKKKKKWGEGGGGGGEKERKKRERKKKKRG